MFNFDEVLLDYINKIPPRKLKLGEYHVSSVYKCPRLMYYEYMTQLYPDSTEEYKKNTETMRIFQIGHVIHDYVENVLKREGKLVASETHLQYQLDHDILLSGHYDAMIQDNGSLKLVEFKSTKALPKQAYDHHVIQLNTYLVITGLTQGYIVYIEKNTLKTRQFIVERNNEMFCDVILKLKLLDKHLKEQTLPNPKKTWLCKFCDFKEKCEKEEE